ncbi:lytic transglycosylase, partial [Streptomyces sp. AC563]|nr:lytic transglycosylase [Streptomyces buecherae]
TPPTTPPPTTPPAPKPEKSLTRVGDQRFTATEGTSFDTSPEVRAVDSKGKPLAGVRVRFEIRGETEARFYGLTDQVTVFSRLDGTAQAPKIMAGKKVGTFTVRATLVDEPKGAVDFTGVVAPRPAPTPTADAVTRTDTLPLTAKPDASFVEPITVRATHRGKPAADVKFTATMISSAADAAPNDKGPYFKDAQGKPVRTLDGLKTDAKGQLVLPQVFTDGTSGTFLLRLTTADGA